MASTLQSIIMTPPTVRSTAPIDLPDGIIYEPDVAGVIGGRSEVGSISDTSRFSIFKFSISLRVVRDDPKTAADDWGALSNAGCSDNP